MSPELDLQRFVDAQAPVYRRVCDELRAGEKLSHWMWFIFPQLRGLGRSPVAQRFGLASRAEALAYHRHPRLGPRLEECCRLVLAIEGRTALQIFGSPDDLKLRSCATLFAQVAPEVALFRDLVIRYFGGEWDPRTIERL